jgi:dipeptidyl aminopeptidase/acylaminoacyl peptidase
MHDDLIDAVDWSVAQGIADPARVAIMGTSYGGYSALVGVDLYAGEQPIGDDFDGSTITLG